MPVRNLIALSIALLVAFVFGLIQVVAVGVRARLTDVGLAAASFVASALVALLLARLRPAGGGPAGGRPAS
jgi:hypothetical protein